MKKAKLVIGFITYGELTANYLPYFLNSIKKQSYKDFKILSFDNSEKEINKNSEFILKNYPEIEIIRVGENIGFARAYNILISQAVKIGAEYFLLLNPDLILEPEAIKELMKVIEGDNRLGSVSPKILQWDFKNNKKTNVIDTYGVALRPGLRFIDIGQGQIDKGQFDNIEILGPSGAAALYRIRALEQIAHHSHYFDELMFMYKEDCDLAYRLYLAGYKSKYVDQAIVYHDRTVKSMGENNLKVMLNRKEKGRQAKRWAFLNQQIIFFKYWRLQNRRNKMLIFWFGLKMLIFVLLFEQYLLGQFIKLWKIRKKIRIYQ